MLIFLSFPFSSVPFSTAVFSSSESPPAPPLSCYNISAYCEGPFTSNLQVEFEFERSNILIL